MPQLKVLVLEDEFDKNSLYKKVSESDFSSKTYSASEISYNNYDELAQKALDEGILVGYAGSWHILDEAHITNIAISTDFRRRKYGEALLKRIIDDCYKEKIKYITLEVRVSNTPAINLYSKYGFTSFGTRKGYYQDNNEDAMIMWTKNIFFDEFKIPYEKIVKDLEEKIIIK